MSDVPSSAAPKLLPSRALTSLSTHLATELRLLGRLYYKNRAQHRNALYWRRVEEVKRLALRVGEGLPLVLSTTKGKEGCTIEPKTEEKAWRVFGGLVVRLQASLPKLYASLHKMILLAQFLPLITLLVALGARLYALNGALVDHVDTVFAGKGWRVLGRPPSSVKDEEDKRQMIADATRPPKTVASAVRSKESSISTNGLLATSSTAIMSALEPAELGEVIRRRPPPPPTAVVPSSSTEPTKSPTSATAAVSALSFQFKDESDDSDDDFGVWTPPVDDLLPPPPPPPVRTASPSSSKPARGDSSFQQLSKRSSLAPLPPPPSSLSSLPKPTKQPFARPVVSSNPLSSSSVISAASDKKKLKRSLPEAPAPSSLSIRPALATSDAAAAPSPPKKKVKKKLRDAIDDIFG